MNANRKWVKHGECYELHFTKFLDNEIVMQFVADPREPNCYIYMSEILKEKFNYIYAENIEKVKEQLEDMYTEYLRDSLDYYKELLRKWEE